MQSMGVKTRPELSKRKFWKLAREADKAVYRYFIYGIIFLIILMLLYDK
jgi:hypothetical protein